jgi:hypothetical protein
MSADPQAFDAYRSPPLPDVPYIAGTQSRRPGLLTIVCVICIVLGALGLINSLAGTAGAMAGRRLQSMFRMPAMPGKPDEDFKKAQKQAEDDMYAVLVKYWWAIMASMAMRLIVAILLLVGGIRSLGLHESGRKTLLIACVLALPLELGYAILQTFMQLENMTAINSFAEALSQQQTDANIGKTMQYIFRASMIASIVLATLLALGKIAFYTFSVIYLQRPRVRALFQRALPAAVIPDS